MYGRRKTRVGVVVSNKMQKTVVVAVETHKRHPLYNKIMRRNKHYKAHDEKETCTLGDTVRIVESRPLSRQKRWRVAEVLIRREVAEVAPREIDASIIERPAPEVEEAAPAEAATVPEVEEAAEPEAAETETKAEAEPETKAEAEEEAEAAPETETEEEKSKQDEE